MLLYPFIVRFRSLLGAMAADRYFYVAREGWPFVLAAGLAAFLVQYYAGPRWAVPLWVAAVFLAYLFREPERFVPGGALAVLSPADGVVTAVAQTRDPYLDRDATLIKVGMNRLGAYAMRSPVEGTVMQHWGEPVTGKSSPADGHGIWLRTDEGDNVVLALDSGRRLLRARCAAQLGERIGQGHRCGFVPFGSRVAVFLPVNTRMDVMPGQRVKAGVDTLARLVHK